MNKRSENIAIIPARGGSKRIPRKNIIDFMGKPLIAWTIEAALQSNLFDSVVVSTDDEEIAEVSRAYGAEVPILRTQAADDFSPVSEATLATLRDLEQSFGRSYKNVVQLFAVCPLRTSADINEMFIEYQSKSMAFLLSAYKFGWMNPWWAYKINDGIPLQLFNDTLVRSQDLEPLYGPTGAIWIADVEELKKSGTFYGTDFSFFEINWKSAIDIDNFEDLEMAKALFMMRSNNSIG